MKNTARKSKLKVGESYDRNTSRKIKLRIYRAHITLCQLAMTTSWQCLKENLGNKENLRSKENAQGMWWINREDLERDNIIRYQSTMKNAYAMKNAERIDKRGW